VDRSAEALTSGEGRTLPVIFSVSSQIGAPTPVGRVRPVLNLVPAASSEEAAQLGGSFIDEIVREGARRMLAAALQAEVADYIARFAGGNPTRLHSDAAFAALCGVSPVQASSGLRQRHRLNRGGDRDANNALWTIANNRLIHDPRRRAYADKRTAQGDTRKDTLRMLKRYIAREVFGLITTAHSSAGSTTARGPPQRLAAAA
jgi:hypothetical protein